MYEGFETWTNKRFAWEFLRRKAEFIDACNGLAGDATEAKKRTVARKFGLAHFKHYSEQYETNDGTVKVPVFLSKAVLVIKPLRPNARKKPPIFVVGPGQFGIRFDLKFAVADDTIFEAQLKTAANILERELKRLRKLKGIEGKLGRARPRARLLEQLKILDALALLGTHAQRAELLWGNGAKEKRFVDRIDAAKDMANEEYLLLAALAEKAPTSKA